MRRSTESITERCASGRTFVYSFPGRTLLELSGADLSCWHLIDDAGSIRRILGTDPAEPTFLGRLGALVRLWRAGLLELDEHDLASLALAITERAAIAGLPPDGAGAIPPEDPWVSLRESAEAGGQLVKCHIELTHACNLRCVHCYNPRQRSTAMGSAKLRDLLDALRAAGCLLVTLTGGEPLARWDLADILVFARENGLVISLSTNGTLLTDAWCDRLRDADLLSVDVSVYGLSRDTYAEVTGRADGYDCMVKGVSRLRRAGIPVLLKYILTRLNADDAARFPAFASGLNASYIVHLPKLFPRQDGDRTPLEYGISNERYQDLLRAGVIQLSPRRIQCGAGMTRICVDPAGLVHPCEFLPLTLGDLRLESLSTICERARAGGVFGDPHISQPKRCNGCAVRPFCIRCPAMSYAESRRLDQPSNEACRVARLAAIATSATPHGADKPC